MPGVATGRRPSPPPTGSRGLLALLLGLLAIPAIASAQPPSVHEPWTTVATHGAADFERGELQNLLAVGGELRLRDEDGDRVSTAGDVHALGLYSSPTLDPGGSFEALRVAFESAIPAGSGLVLEVRVASGEGRWSEWEEVQASGSELLSPVPAEALQYRATLIAEAPNLSPSLREVRVEVRRSASGAAEAGFQAMATRPTVRLYGTRLGLVGRATANGHRIVERDRFAVLPSRKALNLRDGRDYQVEISYRDRKTTIPIWDVGPWNTKDNFWDASREIFSDLPRFTPQVNAAFFNNHNDGKDQYGRPVLFPAAIDIADGSFWDDLGMKQPDWVDVTLLWVDAAAPPLVPMPKVVHKQGPVPQPIFAQSAGGSAAAAPQPQRPAAPTPTPTPTPPPKTWYFAEGSTSKPFDTWLLLQNPDPVPASARITYMLPSGGQKIRNYLLKPTSRMSIFLNEVVPDTEVSTLIESDRYILAERAMYFGNDGHDTVGTIAPSTTWYFAEGGTAAPFDTWILMQNPSTQPATATLTFFREDGSTVTHRMLIPHVSRVSLLVNHVVPDSPVGTRIEADRPIVAERAVYKEKGRAGTDSIGATALSRTWYMAEGVTRGGFDTWLLMLNPNDVPAVALATYMKEDGSTIPRSYAVPPRSRVSIHVNQEVPETRVATKVDSDMPIVAERSVYFPGGLGAHTGLGAPEPSRLWYLPEGSTQKPFWENVLVMNPNAAPATITASFMKEDGTSVEQKHTLKPTSRLTLEMNSLLPDTAFSTRIQSDQPVVVERSMYFSDWKGGHSSMGIPR